MQDLFAEIAQVAKAYPHSLALISRSGNLDYRTLVETIESIAGHALAEGLTGGQIVHVETDNDDMRLLLFLGLMRAGMTVAVLQSLGRAFLQTGIGPDVAVTDRSEVGPLAERARRIVRFTKEWFGRSPQLADRIPHAPDYGLIFVSSGSTGRQKPIFESRQNIDFNIALKRVRPMFANYVRFLSGFPLTSHGCFPWYLSVLAEGGSIIQPRHYSPDEIVATTSLLRPSFVKLPPFTLVNLLKLLERSPQRFRKVDFLYLSGAYCTLAIRRQALEQFAGSLFTDYGASEVSTIAWGQFTDSGEPEGYVGRPAEGMTVETVDDNRRPLPQGTEGEIRLKPSSAAITRYLTKDGCTDVLTDGWFYPGDIGQVDEYGRLVLTGRKTTVINLGGNKINPEDAEGLLIGLDGVEDVAVAGVVGENGFQTVCALVVATRPLDIDDVNRFLADRRARFSVETLKLVTEIPRNPNRKIDRRAVQGIAASA